MGLECMWFRKIVGTNPQTGAQVDEYDCAINWLPLLLIESANQTRGTQAAVESLRNESVKGTEATIQTLKMVSGNPDLKLIEG
jgi:hypothetical protein